MQKFAYYKNIVISMAVELSKAIANGLFGLG
jgi:hypothetical protein